MSEELTKAIKWWQEKSLEQQLYLAIDANHLLEGDTVDNHPHKLSKDSILIIYKYHNE